MERIATVILSQNNGKGADLVFLCEVENISVLERLRQEYLQAAAYRPAILLEGPDERGIDCAFLTRLPLDGSPALHPITLSKVNDPSKVVERTTRAIFQADFKLPGGERLSALAIHFPAGFHPIEHRKEALSRLKEVAQDAAKKSQIVLAAGDFNINFKEAPELYNNIAARDWQITHLEGCKECEGTYYYAKDEHWSFLDAIMVFKGGIPAAHHRWKMDPDSIRIVNENVIQKKKTGFPLKFMIDKDGEPRGVSDHFPVWMQLKAEAL
jgi:endonuclease/exonuclease/phosphatase family metal-dependent hydrolase